MSILSYSLADKIKAVTLAYYRQVEQFSPAERDLIDWFVQLPQAAKTAAAQVAYDTWPALPSFQQFYLEKKGHGLHAYLANQLTEQELAQWVDETIGDIST